MAFKKISVCLRIYNQNEKTYTVFWGGRIKIKLVVSDSSSEAAPGQTGVDSHKAASFIVLWLSFYSSFTCKFKEIMRSSPW